MQIYAIEGAITAPPTLNLKAGNVNPKAARLKPIGFWSYAGQDDHSSNGRLDDLRRLLVNELQQVYGREPVKIWQDVSAIPPGAEWENSINQAIGQSSFLIPIITPAFIESEWCNKEVVKFLDREREIASTYPNMQSRRLIFPIYYIDISKSDPFDPVVKEQLERLQFTDFRALRHSDFSSIEVRKTISRLAEELNSLLRMRIETSNAPSAGDARLETGHQSAPVSPDWPSPGETGNVPKSPEYSRNTDSEQHIRSSNWQKWTVVAVAASALLTGLAWFASGQQSGSVDSSLAHEESAPVVSANENKPSVAVVKSCNRRLFSALSLSSGAINFTSGGATIASASLPRLDTIAAALKASCSDIHFKVIVRVHIETGMGGYAAFRQNLSQSRGNAVVAALIDRGVSSENLTAVGSSEFAPDASLSPYGPIDPSLDFTIIYR